MNDKIRAHMALVDEYAQGYEFSTGGSREEVESSAIALHAEHKPLFGEMIAQHPGLREEMLAESERAEFEADAEPMGFDLTRRENICVEPWSDYADSDTGHRWGGWLGAALRSMPAEPVAYSVTRNGRHVGNLYDDIESATTRMKYLNQHLPEDNRAVVPLFATPHTAPVPAEPVGYIDRRHLEGLDSLGKEVMLYDRSVSIYHAPIFTSSHTELLLGWTRYEKLRRLRPVEFGYLHRRNLAGERFDDMVDALSSVSTPVPHGAPVLLTEAELEAFLIEQQFLLFCDMEECKDIARAIESEVLRRVGGGV